jgi:hypothetical protein
MKKNDSHIKFIFHTGIKYERWGPRSDTIKHFSNRTFWKTLIFLSGQFVAVSHWNVGDYVIGDVAVEKHNFLLHLIVCDVAKVIVPLLHLWILAKMLRCHLFFVFSRRDGLHMRTFGWWCIFELNFCEIRTHECAGSCGSRKCTSSRPLAQVGLTAYGGRSDRLGYICGRKPKIAALGETPSGTTCLGLFLNRQAT